MTWDDRVERIAVLSSDGSISYIDADTLQRLTEREHLSDRLGRSGDRSGQRSGRFPRAAHDDILRRGDFVPPYNPHRVHREFPDRWQGYVRANYRGLGHVQQVFGVSERTARKWWNGETGANGGHVAIAMREHPVQAQQMLFAAE